MMWLIQYIASLAETADVAMKAITWMPTQAGVNLIFAQLCFVAAVVDVCPRRVMAFSAMLYLLLSAI